jgi:hypothetical protein
MHDEVFDEMDDVLVGNTVAHEEQMTVHVIGKFLLMN